jgi:hypothetical protein
LARMKCGTLLPKGLYCDGSCCPKSPAIAARAQQECCAP